ncbi:hypothetical protein AXG93_2035s1740 [Marchantia polymorpha subsp. ruderalis]|uniref:F-box associated domain-containing protein n=1 Tax=Marchantia polymorpha subsp. ruderalis TaxID=1480154 RepID=A0A176VPF1_MARPO|nr:hypothetical protein AXG93_2035s1740 [Marchantia polymorpha subsp. ruderalis]
MAVEGEEDRPHYLWETLPIELLVNILRDQDRPVFTLAECRLVFPDKFLILNVPHEVDGLPTVFDGKLKCIMVGLVVNQSTKHFKLVLGGVLFPDRRRSLIYNSTTSTWSWIIDQFPTLLNWRKVECKDGKSELCNGCVYWLVFDPTFLIRALLIFDLSEERWNVMAEEVREDTSDGLHITAYKGRLCLLAMDWSNIEMDGRSYEGNFLRHPMVQRMDGSLMRRYRDRRDFEDGVPFKIYGAGGSDLFFVDDMGVHIEIGGEYEYLEVARYWSELDLMVNLPELPHPDRLENGNWIFEPKFFYDPWYAMIPSPGVNAQQEWIAQQQRHL